MSFSLHSTSVSRFDGVKHPASHFVHPTWATRATEQEYKQQITIIQSILRDPEINPEWRVYSKE